jgi:hypothetical protein
VSNEHEPTGYKQAVTDAAEALRRGEDANWMLARLTAEHTINRGDPNGRVTMEQWCADVRERSGRRFSLRTGRAYKAMWRRYEHRDDRPEWADGWREVIGSESTADREAGVIRRTTPDQAMQTWTPEQRADAARTLIKDSSIREDLARDEDVRDSVRGQLSEEMTRPTPPPAGAGKALGDAVGKVYTEAELGLMKTLGGWRHHVDLLARINEHNVELDSGTYAELVDLVQRAAVELRFYAIRHGLDEPTFEKVDSR